MQGTNRIAAIWTRSGGSLETVECYTESCIPPIVPGYTYIYGLIDPRLGKIRYIGKTIHPRERFMQHFQDTRGNTHKENWLAKLIGTGLFPAWMTLDIVKNDTWQDSERHWIAQGRLLGWPLTNLTPGADGSPVGQPVSKETREKLSKSSSGRTHSPKTRSKISRFAKNIFKDKRNHPNYGKSPSKETRDKIRQTLLGHTMSKESCERMSISALLYRKRTSKFTLSQIIDIRKRYGLGNVTMPQLADMFGTTKSTIYDYIRRPPGWTGLEGIHAGN